MKLFALALAFVSAQAFAGAANTVINCTSADKKITVSGNVPGDMSDFSLDVKLANKGPQELKFYSDYNETTNQQEEDATIVVIDDLRKGVYTLESDMKADANSNGATVRLYAFPKTINLHELGSGNLKSSFTGRLQVYGDNVSADTTVTCTTVYEI